MVLFLSLKLECCGASNYTDWEGSEWKKINEKKKVPLSCCKEGKDTLTCNNATGFNSDNIHTKVMLWYSFLFTRSHARTYSLPATHSRAYAQTHLCLQKRQLDVFMIISYPDISVFFFLARKVRATDYVYHRQRSFFYSCRAVYQS